MEGYSFKRIYMSSSRLLNSKKNLFFGLINKILIIGTGLIIPHLIIVSLGSDANGLVTSVNQVFAYVALLEAGIGTAAVQSLYKPVANNDRAEISRIVSAVSFSYRKTGFWYFICVVSLSVVYPMLVDTPFSNWAVIAVIIFNGMGGVINFFFQAKFKLLLQAEGKDYVTTNLTTIVHVLSNVVKILLLLNGFGLVAIQAAYFVFNILQMIYIVYYVKKNYQWLDLKTKPNFDALKEQRAVLIHQIAGLIFNNTDVLLITIITGNLKLVSVYSMYVFVYGMVTDIQTQVIGASSFAFGQLYQTNRQKFIKYNDCYEKFVYALCFTLYTTTAICITPFLRLYTAGVNDISYIDEFLPYLFFTMRMLSTLRVPMGWIIGYAQKNRDTLTRALVEAGINLFSSIILIYFYGIYGAILGTIFALFYRTNDMIIYGNHKLLNRSCKRSYLRILIHVPACAVSIIAGHIIDFKANNYFCFLFYAFIVFVIQALCNFAVFFISEKETRKNIIGLIESVLKNK